MEYYYLIIIVILFALAISDLIVGVSNDAVNFLNSAIGSKAAPFRIIIAVAALGVLVGATFSSGMMEVARKGIFHPDMFHFNEIMIIFLAVMFTDILLLDLFNTFGLPTSTTVSIVFELLGSAVAVAVVKITRAAEGLANLSLYINSDRALAIITGIFISIVISFTVGAIIQWFVRLMFSFNSKRSINFWGGLWGGISIAAISYFMLIKGAKGASFMSESTVDWIHENSFRIILFSFLIGGIIFQLLINIAKVNVLKIIVLIGTFALAMAFAGNDLVNFIGVPLAGYESFTAFHGSGADPSSFPMEILKEPVKTPTFFLLIAGLIMAVTLRFSSKSKSVTATTIDLSRQNEGTERFTSSAFARWLVRIVMDISLFFRRITPAPIQNFIDSRFDESVMRKKDRKKHEILAFDLVRASVNLVVAAILISIGTSLKLPLSTTYVTFMVAMGTSLSDKAWGRESAVYRITGVFAVVGGWFLTAISAFSVAFLIAIIIDFGGMVAIITMAVLVVFIVVRTHIYHKKRQKAEKKAFSTEKIDAADIIENCNDTVRSILANVSKNYYLALLNFNKEKRKGLLAVKKETKEILKETKALKQTVHLTIDQLSEDDIETGHYYVEVLDYLKETSNCLTFIVNPLFNHIDNNHRPLDKKESEELGKFNDKMSEFFNFALTILKQQKPGNFSDLKKLRDEMIEESNTIRKSVIKSIKNDGKKTKVTLLLLDVLTESKNMVMFVTNVIQAQREFTVSGKGKKMKLK